MRVLIMSMAVLTMVYSITPVYGQMVSGLFNQVSHTLEIAQKAD